MRGELKMVTARRFRWAFLGLALAFASRASFASDLSLQEIEVDDSGGHSAVVLTLSEAAQGSAVSTFTLSQPPQVVIDLANAVPVKDVGALVDKSALIQRVAVETFDDSAGKVTRVRLYLSGAATPKVTTTGNTVRVALETATPAADPLASALGGGTDTTASSGAPAATTTGTPATATPAATDTTATASTAREPGAATAASETPPTVLSGPNAIANPLSLSSLDFQALNDVSRVVIGTTKAIDYVATQPRSNLIVLDFPGAFVPQSLTRSLDASQFVSPVRVVRAYRTSSGARVAIDLRQDATYTVTKQPNGLLYVDIPVPESMRQERTAAVQAAAAVSPSDTSGQGMSNAESSEILIGGKGHTVNPQTAFGSGSGSNDPSALLGAAAGFSMDTNSASDTPFTGRKISLDFANADIHAIFRLISSVSKLNIIASDDVKGTVTVRMEDVPWDLAFAAVLQAKGLGSQRFGNVVRVAPIETIKAEQQAALEAKHAQDDLEDLQLLVVPLNYAQATDMAAQVKSVLSKRGSVQTDTRGNQLIIQDSQDRLAQVRELLRHLDKQTPQVLIEARVVEASASFERALGIQWGGELDASTATGYSTGLFFPNNIGISGGMDESGKSLFYSRQQSNLLVDLGSTASAGALSFSLGSIPGLGSLDARLSAMESDGHGKVISSPRVTTLDNETATIKQGAKIPYTSTSAGGTQVQFILAALTMDVTPHITSDGKVFLKIAIANNRPDFSQAVNGQPAISIKEAETQVLVADGDTTVIGGVFATNEAWSQERVPFLSKIPVIGYLFKNSDHTESRNEMIVFITPRIVTRAMDATQG